MSILSLKYKYIFIIALIVFICAEYLLSNQVHAQEPAPSDVNPSGQELFIQNRCVRCHTIGRGKFVGPDLAGVKDRFSKEQIIKWIQNPQLIYQQTGKMPFNEGYPPMPPLNVPPEQVEAIADYVLSAKAPTDGAQSGSISGQVLNNTTNQPASGVELILTPYMADNAGEELTVKSDEQGNFQFDNLPWDRSYQITVNYLGAEYSTDKMVFFPNEQTKILTLPIFEPTVEEGDISVVESHLIVQAEESVLAFADLTLFDNSGDRIFVGGKELPDGRKESLRFNTPEQAQSINFIHGINPDDIVKTPYGFADTTSVMPGEKRVVFSYELPLISGTTKFEKIIEYPTGNFLLLLSDPLRTVDVQGLTGGETREIRGQSYREWTGENLSPGHKIVVELTDPAIKPDFVKWGALGVLSLIIIFGIVYSLVSKNKTSSVVDNESTQPSMSEANRISLIKEIASLDDSYEAGQIDKDTYQRVRKEKLEELKKIHGDRDRS
jgi:mono/diheme cytochrome c family protein